MHRLLLIFLLATPLQAKDLGTFGPVFEIAEEDMRNLILRRLKKKQENGEMASLQEEIRQKAKARILRPTPVEGLVKTTEPRTYSYDPTLTVPQDIKDLDGNLIAAKGTRINPLEIKPLTKSLILIDGDDEDQVTWALSQEGEKILILVKGSPIKLEEKTGEPVYFDQGGMMCKKFGITQVPAKITQEGNKLKIEEVKI